MSAKPEQPGSPEADRVVCGRWMPRRKTTCARRLGHKNECKSAEGLRARREQRSIGRQSGQRERDDPEVQARWRRNYRFRRLGITEARYLAMLEEQGRACAMCSRIFSQDERIFADHDHSCCPAEADRSAKTCGKCIRGLLCFRCNTALGYIELYRDRADAYLARFEESRFF